MKTNTISRRSFFPAMLAPVLFARSGSAHAMDPATGFAAVSFVLNLISTFVQSGSGLEAMLRAQYELSLVIIGQLERIQTKLAELTNLVQQLDEKVKRYLMDQLTLEHGATLRAEASRYKLMVEAGLSNEAYWTSPLTVDALKASLGRVQSASGILSKSQAGMGPEAAFLVPLSAAIEAAILLRLGAPREMIRVSISVHEEWLRDAISEKDRSIPSELKLAMIDHDAAIERAQNTSWGKELNIIKFKINENQYGRSGTYSCNMIYRGAAPEDRGQVHRVGNIMAGWATMGNKSVSHHQWSVVEIVVDDTKAKLINYRKSLRQIANAMTNRNPIIDGFPPPDGVWCKNTAVEPWPFPSPAQDNYTSSVIEYVEKKGFSSWYEEQRAASGFTAALAEANLLRRRIAYCYFAQVLAAGTLQRLKSAKEQYI